MSVSSTNSAQFGELSKKKAVTKSNKYKENAYNSAAQFPLCGAEGGEIINGSAPVSVMGSDPQESNTTQGKEKGKNGTWTDFVSNMSSKPASKINEECLEKQSAEESFLRPDKGGVTKDISRITDRSLIDLAEVESQLDLKHLSKEVKDKVRKI